MVKSQNRVPPAFLDTSLYRAAKTWLDNKAAKKHNVLADAQTVKSFARHWIIEHLRRQRKGMHRIVFPCNGRSFTKYLSQKNITSMDPQITILQWSGLVRVPIPVAEDHKHFRGRKHVAGISSPSSSLTAVSERNLITVQLFEVNKKRFWDIDWLALHLSARFKTIKAGAEGPASPPRLPNGLQSLHDEPANWSKSSSDLQLFESGTLLHFPLWVRQSSKSFKITLSFIIRVYSSSKFFLACCAEVEIY